MLIVAARFRAGVFHGMRILTASAPMAAAVETPAIIAVVPTSPAFQYESIVSNRAGALRLANSGALRAARPGPMRKPSQLRGRKVSRARTGSSRPGTRPSIVPWSSGSTTVLPSGPKIRPIR